MKSLLKACLTGLVIAMAQPALADETPKSSFADLLKQLEQTPDVDSLKRYISRYEAQYRRLDVNALSRSMAPSMLAQLAREDKISPEQWQRESREGIRYLKSLITVRRFDVTVGNVGVLAGSASRSLAVLTACLVANKGPEMGLVSQYPIVAVYENERWFMVPIDDAAHEQRAKRLYPVLADQTFAEPTLRRINVDTVEELESGTFCTNPNA